MLFFFHLYTLFFFFSFAQATTRTRKRFIKGIDDEAPKSRLIQESDEEEEDLYDQDLPSYASSMKSSASSKQQRKGGAVAPLSRTTEEFIEDDEENEDDFKGISTSAGLLEGDDEYDRKDAHSNNIATAIQIFGEDYLKYIERDEDEEEDEYDEEEEEEEDAYEYEEDLEEEDLTEEERAARREERRKQKQKKKEAPVVSLTDVLEPYLLESGFQTEADELLRVKDIPERFQVKQKKK